MRRHIRIRTADTGGDELATQIFEFVSRRRLRPTARS
jgi:hypothetical protein